MLAVATYLPSGEKVALYIHSVAPMNWRISSLFEHPKAMRRRRDQHSAGICHPERKLRFADARSACKAMKHSTSHRVPKRCTIV
jgi:hypothetical protein